MTTPQRLFGTDEAYLDLYTKMIDTRYYDLIKYIESRDEESLIPRRETRIFSNDIPVVMIGWRQYQTTHLEIYPTIGYIMREVNQNLGTEFNTVILDRYRDGKSKFTPHSDSIEQMLKYDQRVAMIALGPGERSFYVRQHQKATSENKFTTVLYKTVHQAGDLLMMGGDFQSYYCHEIPPNFQMQEERIILTFRRYIPRVIELTIPIEKDGNFIFSYTQEEKDEYFKDLGERNKKRLYSQIDQLAALSVAKLDHAS